MDIFCFMGDLRQKVRLNFSKEKKYLLAFCHDNRLKNYYLKTKIGNKKGGSMLFIMGVKKVFRKAMNGF